MTLKITPADTPPRPERAAFLSASIPDPHRWSGEYDALAITDAVVALARAFLTAGWQLVSAAHPTIAPLLLYVAAELQGEGERRVSIYQSALFEDVLPTATRRFEADGIGTVVWTEAVEGDKPVVDEWHASLKVMRQQMLLETEPDVALFVGGMDGIPDEYALFGQLRPGSPRYALGGPGGAAREIALQDVRTPLQDDLAHGVVYPALARRILLEVEPSR